MVTNGSTCVSSTRYSVPLQLTVVLFLLTIKKWGYNFFEKKTYWTNTDLSEKSENFFKRDVKKESGILDVIHA